MASSEQFVFTEPLSYRTETIEKKGVTEKKYYVEGHVSTSELDLVNDIVSPKAMKSMLNQLNQRVMKLDFEHEAFIGETDKERKAALTKLPLGKAIDARIDEKGLRVEWELNPNWKARDSEGNITYKFQEIWKSIKDEFLDAFSIAFYPVKTSMKQLGEKSVRVLEDLKLLNVALTGNPANPGASMASVVAKSLTVEEKNTLMASQEDNQNDDFEVKSQIENLQAEIKSLKETFAESKSASQEDGDGDSQPEGKSLADLKSQLEAEKKAREDAESQLKSITEEFKSLKEDYTEIKSILDEPTVKSILEQRKNAQADNDKQGKQFTEEEIKNLGPLDAWSMF